MLLEQDRAERRRKRQGVECGDDSRDRDRDGELLVELAGQAADECGRHKHGAEHQRGGDDRAGDLAHGAFGRLDRRQPQGDVPLDVFHDDDGIVHDNADGQHQAEEREIVDRKAQREHHGEGADQRHRHCGQRDDGGAPGLEKQDDDQHDQQRGLQQRMHDRLDRVAHEDGGVIHHGVVHAVREVLLQLLHGAPHVGGELQGIGPGRLKDRQGYGGLVVEQRTQGIAVGAEFDAGHVPEQGLLAVGAGLEDDPAELLAGRSAGPWR